ncbi:hypothetical protein F5Y18DRAFT_419843 [Xylariaceae sp. FL1019]|nr:hypothetical protein F5Y18DRAFT_419843 [Xylariaceae sp. FL1019]
MWNSVWLRTEVLVSFILIFATLFLVTIILYHVSETNHGLSDEVAARQYGWRYGPTALLTVVLSLWVQVDYANKFLIPWKELRQGPATADRSVLLEYISPLMVTTFWRALTRRHLAVTASILGTLLIQLATIFSAGLFVLEPTILEQNNIPMAVTNSFDGNDFYLSNVSSNGTSPTVLYFGTRVHGLAPDAGVDTAKGLVVPNFAPISSMGITNGTNYTATVPGVQSNLECEHVTGLNGTETSLPWYSILGQFFVANITTPSCSLTNVIVGEGPDHDFYHQKNATQAYQGYFYDFMCDPSVDWSYPSDSHPLPTNRTFEHRVVMTMVDLRFAAYNASLSSPAYIYVHDLTVAVCKASYAMGDYDVTYNDNANGGSKTMTAEKVSDAASEIGIPGFASADLGAAVQYSLEDTQIGTGGDDWVLSLQVATFYQILSAMNGGGTIGAFMDPALLIRYGTEAFNGIATQLIHKFMMKPTNTAIEGSMLQEQNRLWVRELSVGFMAASFLVLLVLSVVILCVRPVNVVPSDPGSIGATALILAESSKLRDLLSGLGASRSTDITRRVLPYNFRSILSPGFRSTFIVEPIEGQEPVEGRPEHSTDQPRSESWWIPASVKWWFQVLAILIPLVLIAALEVIQQLSDKHQGFLDVDENGFAISHAFSTYVPALVAFIVSSMFSSMQLAVCILAPWFALHRGSATASRSLFLNLTNRLAPHRMYLAIKSGNVGALLIMVGTFLGAWLPIIVSGLYLIVSVPAPEAFTILPTDMFDFRQNNTLNGNLFYDDNLAGTVAGLIAYNGLAYPKWTSNDLVFNALQTSSIPHGIPSGDELPFTLQLQATRPSLQCDVIPQSLFIDSWDSEAWETGFVPKDRAALNHTAVLPWMCEEPWKDRAESFPWFQGFALPTNGTPMYFGHASVLSWTNESVAGNRAVDTDFNQPGATMYEDGAAENWVGGYGCPSFSVTLGRGSALAKKVETKNSTRTIYEFDVDITSIMCKQYLETVEANVTLTLPSLGVISPDKPPIPDETTATYLTNILPYHTGHVFEFALNELLLTLASGTGNISFPAPKGGLVENDSLDNFVRFLGTVNASSPIESYIGADNTQNLIDATNRLYKIYMPQAISNNLRSANISNDVTTRDGHVARAVGDPVSTQVYVPNRLRLKQEAAPKLVLQILLAVMVLCAIASRVMLRGIDKVVPHNPSTIAGRAALFADGEVSTRKLVPFGAEWQTESELKRRGVFEGWLFSLGWWEESLGEYKYGVDVGWIDKGESEQT